MIVVLLALYIFNSAIIPISDGIMEPPKFLQPEDADWCTDTETKCSSWAQAGECQNNPAWMMTNCKRSCQSCQGGESAWKLRDALASKYDNKTRSLRQFLSQNLSLHSFLIDRLKIDESEQNVKMHGKMVLTWNDSRISWNPEEWKLSWLTFFWTQIWTPQIIQTNAPIGALASTYNGLLAANYTGQIYFWQDFVFSLNTNFQYSAFPFDQQRVCFSLDNKRYFAIRFVASNLAKWEASNLANKVAPSGWIVENVDIIQRKDTVKIVREWDHDPLDIDKSTVDICLTFKRDSSYVNVEIVAPSLVPALLTLTSFLLNDFKKQIYMLVASLFMQILAIYPIHNLLPPAAGNATPTILKFAAFNTTMTCLILLIVVLLYSLSSASSNFIPPPRFLTNFVSVIEKYADTCLCCCFFKSPPSQQQILAAASNSTSTNAGPTMGNGDFTGVTTNGGHISDKGPSYFASTSEAAYVAHKYQWEPVAKALKCLLFALSLFLYVILLLACFVF